MVRRHPCSGEPAHAHFEETTRGNRLGGATDLSPYSFIYTPPEFLASRKTVGAACAIMCISPLSNPAPMSFPRELWVGVRRIIKRKLQETRRTRHGHTDGKKIGKVIREVEEVSLEVRSLGSYPKAIF